MNFLLRLNESEEEQLFEIKEKMNISNKTKAIRKMIAEYCTLIQENEKLKKELISISSENDFIKRGLKNFSDVLKIIK